VAIASARATLASITAMPSDATAAPRRVVVDSPEIFDRIIDAARRAPSAAAPTFAEDLESTLVANIRQRREDERPFRTLIPPHRFSAPSQLATLKLRTYM
jgi:hypothetical protein